MIRNVIKNFLNAILHHLTPKVLVTLNIPIIIDLKY